MPKFKKGDLVKCISIKNMEDTRLTLNREYRVIYATPSGFIMVIDDNENIVIQHQSRFKRIKRE